MSNSLTLSMSNILTVQFLYIICSQYNSQTVYGV